MILRHHFIGLQHRIIAIFGRFSATLLVHRNHINTITFVLVTKIIRNILVQLYNFTSYVKKHSSFQQPSTTSGITTEFLHTCYVLIRLVQPFLSSFTNILRYYISFFNLCFYIIKNVYEL